MPSPTPLKPALAARRPAAVAPVDPPSTWRRASAVVAAVGVALLLTACTTSAPEPAPSPTSAQTTTAAPSPSGTAAPVLVPNGTAAENLPFFDSVNTALIASKTAAGQTADGVAFTSALRDAGFAITTMQVTPDITTVGVKADSIQFSVMVGGQCMIGQYGFGAYHSLVAAVLGTGKCLIGETRTIDW